jgi:hypothetical protein
MNVIIKNNNDNVYLKVIITHLGAWRYLYFKSANEDPIRVKQESAGNPPYTHSVGCGKDILFKVNSWNFELQNQSNQDLDYQVQITWYQNNDSNDLKTWTKKGTMKKGAGPLSLDGLCAYEN